MTLEVKPVDVARRQFYAGNCTVLGHNLESGLLRSRGWKNSVPKLSLQLCRFGRTQEVILMSTKFLLLSLLLIIDSRCGNIIGRH